MFSMRKRVGRAVATAALAALLPATALAASNVTKSTFDNVTFSDGTTGVIEAGVKTVNKGSFTTCDFYSADYVTYLGMFEAATAPDNVEQFCLDNFANRTLPK
ncbi:MAG TPA: hypothetical protein VFW96_08050 [Thermomicrobiales bacterium]|nr:hypothetical protein [Thermomicrobiales bacterium]